MAQTKYDGAHLDNTKSKKMENRMVAVAHKIALVCDAVESFQNERRWTIMNPYILFLVQY